MLSLPLFGRGARQVARKNQEKVHLEPEDDLNWKSQCCHYVSRSLDNNDVTEGSSWGLPKTYSTRTDTLILCSEDLTKPSTKLKGCKKSQQRLRRKSWALHLRLHSLQDLVRAILAYGSKKAWKDWKEAVWQPYLRFRRDPAVRTDRQMRPGYSAKRYLLRLVQTWDPNILQKLQRAGYIRDPFVLEETLPYKRKKPQDLSAVPPNYNLLPTFCSPCPHLWVELEKAKPGLGLLSYKKSENEPWLVEGYKGEKHARRKARIPFQISVRKLSFHLSPWCTKERVWKQKAAYRDGAEGCQPPAGPWRPPGMTTDLQTTEISSPGENGCFRRETLRHHIPTGAPSRVLKDPNVEIHQTWQSTKEDRDPTEMTNRSTDYPALEKIHSDTSELWCEKSHMTFYGGFFPGKKISDSVSQRHLKNLEGSEGEPSRLLPLIQPGTSSEQSGVRMSQKKQMPEIFRLPVISRDPLGTRGDKTKPGELPRELRILPLLVRLEREPCTEKKKLRAADGHESSSGAIVCDNLLVPPLPNDHIPEPEHRNKQHQVVSSEIQENPPRRFHLPPISQGEFALSGMKTRKREKCAEIGDQHQKESDQRVQDGILALGPLPGITRKKDPGDQEITANLETSTSTNTGINGVSKDVLLEISESVLQDDLRGHEEELVCLPPLGSVQATGGAAEHFEFLPAEGADGAESPEAKTGASRNLLETSFSAPEFDDKATPQTQETGTVPEHENSLQNGQRIVGNGSTWVESGKEIPPSQDGFSGTELLLQREHKKEHLSLPTIQGPKKKEDKRKQMENLPQSPSFSHLDSQLSQWMRPASEMVDSLEFPGLSTELQERKGVGIHSSGKQVEAEAEGDNHRTSPERPGLQTKITSRSTAAGGLESKLRSRQKKHELRKMGPASKAQKRSPQKEKENRRSQAESAVGKPKQKTAVGKTASFSKEKPGDVKKPGTPEEEEEPRGAEVTEEVAEPEQTVSDTEEDILEEALDKSVSPSLRLVDEGPSPPEDGQDFPAGVAHPSESDRDTAHETSLATHPLVSSAVFSQTKGVPSGALPEVVPKTKGEEKLSRERIIAEKAEKRRLAVERKQQEQEELKRKREEEEERMERMREEMEEERRRRIEEIRLRKQQLQEELQRQEEEAARKLQAEKAAKERVHQQQEELRRKLLEAQKKKEEEERDRAEAEKRRQKEREMWLEEERRHLAEMAEEQRVEYERQKREEEERVRREAEERRKKDEEVARLALEEARKQALLLARQRAEQEQQQQFEHTLSVEASGLERRREISRPWVYSYFQCPLLKVGDED